MSNVKPSHSINRPLLAPHARFRWDEVRRQHEIVFPEGVLVVNESAAAIVRLCDGRTTDELIEALKEEITTGDPSGDVCEFVERLSQKGLLRDAADS